MKKKSVVAILLVLVMCFSLCACGSQSAEDMIAEATAFDTVIEPNPSWSTPYEDDVYAEKIKEYKEEWHGWTIIALEKEKTENVAKVEENYIGNTYTLKAPIMFIENDGIVLGYAYGTGMPSIGASGGVKVYLDTEEIAQVELFEEVEVVGTFIASDSYAVEMKPAHIVE